MRGAEPRRTRGEGAQFGVYWLQILSSLQGRGKKKTKKNTKSCHTPPSREASAQNPNIQNNLKGENYTGIFTSLINRLILIQAPLQTCACGWGMGWPWCSWGRGVGPHPDGSHPWCSPAWGRGLTTAVPTRHRGAHGCRTRQGSASPVPSDRSLTQLQPPMAGEGTPSPLQRGPKVLPLPRGCPVPPAPRSHQPPPPGWDTSSASGHECWDPEARPQHGDAGFPPARLLSLPLAATHCCPGLEAAPGEPSGGTPDKCWAAKVGREGNVHRRHFPSHSQPRDCVQGSPSCSPALSGSEAVMVPRCLCSLPPPMVKKLQS